MKLILLGPQGSGKGTISERLIKDFDFLHVSAGALLREEIEKETSIGIEIKKFVESGELVPDNFVVEMIKLKVRDEKNFILDGFPRSLDQAKEIESLGIDAAIYVDIPKEATIERLSGRRVCEQGHNYHIKFVPPKQEGVCDIDGSKLHQREDDYPQAIEERLKVFNEATKPVIEFYEKKGILKRVDGTPMPKEVYASVKKVVESL